MKRQSIVPVSAFCFIACFACLIVSSFSYRTKGNNFQCSKFEWIKSSQSPEDWYIKTKQYINNISEIKQCLQGERIVFLGDSVTRYQYLNLVYYLLSGNWSSGYPSNEREQDWKSWKDFYEGTNKRLEGHEICDCFKQENAIENRLFRLHGIQIIYMTWAGARPLHGHDLHAMLAHKISCAPGACSTNVTWSLDQDEVLEYVIPSFRPTVVILNQGIWDHLTWRKNHSAVMRTLELARKSVEPQKGIVLWKTTTCRKNMSASLDDIDGLIPIIKASGAEIFDAAKLTRDISYDEASYWDVVHFNFFVYRELNKLLLDGLCRMSIS